MSLENHFEPVRDGGGFAQVTDPKVARRQFNVSAGLAALMGVLALALTFAAPLTPVEVSREKVQLTVQAPQTVYVRHASEAVKANPGG